MKKLIALACIAVLATVALPGAAQDKPADKPPAKPSFAGKWALVPDPNAPAGGRMMLGFGDAFTAAQDDKTLTLTMTLGQMGEVTQKINLDGSPTNNPINFNGTSFDRTSKAKWDGSKLVITTTSDFNGNTFTTTQSLAFDSSSNLIVETTADFGGNGPQTTKATYKKGT